MAILKTAATLELRPIKNEGLITQRIRSVFLCSRTDNGNKLGNSRKVPIVSITNLTKSTGERCSGRWLCTRRKRIVDTSHPICFLLDLTRNNCKMIYLLILLERFISALPNVLEVDCNSIALHKYVSS